MGVNVPLLRKTLEHITAHPEEWAQDVWAKKTQCGTAACLAGTAVQLAGHEISWVPRGWLSDAYFIKGGGAIDEVAEAELGLGPFESGQLFAGHNSLHRLWELAAEFTGGEIAVPDELKQEAQLAC